MPTVLTTSYLVRNSSDSMTETEWPTATERHRLRVKRRYHHTLKGLDASRQLLKQLTLRHHSALERMRSLVVAEAQTSSPSESQQAALRMYVEASDLVDRLLRTKGQLQRDLELREKSAQRLWNLVLEQQDSTDLTPLPVVRVSVG